MDEQAHAPLSEERQAVSIQEEATDTSVPDKGKERTAMEKAIAIRKHLKAGKQRKEIIAVEGFTEKEYRYAFTLFGKHPEKNVEAFTQFLFGQQDQMDDVLADMETARRVGTLNVLPSLHRVLKDLRESIYEMAMKMGINKKAVEEIALTQRYFDVAFGDEAPTKPAWPQGSDKVQ